MTNITNKIDTCSICKLHNKCKIHKVIKLLCLLVNLKVKVTKCVNKRKNSHFEIISHTICCDSNMCEKKKAIKRIVNKYNKNMEFDIITCDDYQQCYMKYWSKNDFLTKTNVHDYLLDSNYLCMYHSIAD